MKGPTSREPIRCWCYIVDTKGSACALWRPSWTINLSPATASQRSVQWAGLLALPTRVWNILLQYVEPSASEKSAGSVGNAGRKCRFAVWNSENDLVYLSIVGLRLLAEEHLLSRLVAPATRWNCKGYRNRRTGEPRAPSQVANCMSWSLDRPLCPLHPPPKMQTKSLPRRRCCVYAAAPVATRCHRREFLFQSLLLRARSRLAASVDGAFHCSRRANLFREVLVGPPASFGGHSCLWAAQQLKRGQYSFSSSRLVSHSDSRSSPLEVYFADLSIFLPQEQDDPHVFSGPHRLRDAIELLFPSTSLAESCCDAARRYTAFQVPTSRSRSKRSKRPSTSSIRMVAVRSTPRS